MTHSDNNGKNPKLSKNALSSADYRAKLLTKLNCLIAVLEVAITKISRSMDLPGANEERLLKIRGNYDHMRIQTYHKVIGHHIVNRCLFFASATCVAFLLKFGFLSRMPVLSNGLI